MKKIKFAVMLTRAEILRVRSLADKKGRTAEGLFVVEGRKMVTEAIASGFEVEEVYATAENADGLGQARVVSPSEFGRISRLKSPQGVLALVRIPEYRTPSARPGELLIALDRLQDPGNLGTIIRTADWFGVRDIVCSPDSADCFNPKTVQATMGSLFRVRVHYTALEGFLRAAVSDRIPVYGTFMDGDSIYGKGLRPDGIIVMGNEGSGISEAIANLITHRISIPQYPAGGGGAESLNVAAATAIIVSEFRRIVAQPSV